MDSVLQPIAMPIITKRLLIRGPQEGDGAPVNEAIHESAAALQKWMAWAQELPSPEQSEANTRRSMARWILREDLWLLVFDRKGQTLLACSGLHRIDWTIGRFEIGYWVRSSQQGRGYIREATTAITQYAFAVLKARRIEIRCDATNSRSAVIPASLGFTLEGVMKNAGLDAQGVHLRDTQVFARTDAAGLPDVQASWP